MKDNGAHIICLILIIIVIAVSILFVIKTNLEDAGDSIYNMAENAPEENLVEEDTLIVQEYEINGTNYEVIAILNIPSLEIEYPVLSSTSTELLKVSLNKYWGPNPNRPGNFCILGHNYNDSRFFGKLNRIENGDIIQLTDMSGEMVEYSVYDTYIVNPDNTDCTSQLTDGKTEITLITCTATGKQRFVVKATKV
ncbi:MAG: sortase [Clostridia bacterium]|nr:sortase [Clostridia bacterium]